MKKSKSKSEVKRGKTVVAPVARSIVQRRTVPGVSVTRGGIVVRHKELFDFVTPADRDNVWYWTIQPGYSELFPWLSAIADRYERYEFKRLIFRYVSRAPSSTQGTLAMAHDLDPNDPTPTVDASGYRVMMSHEAAVSGPAWQTLELHVPTAHLRRRGELYVRNVAEATTVEPRTADFGILFVACFLSAGTTILGDLEVEYEIELKTPQLFTPTTVGQNTGNVKFFPYNLALGADYVANLAKSKFPLNNLVAQNPTVGTCGWETSNPFYGLLPTGVTWIWDSTWSGVYHHCLQFAKAYTGNLVLKWIQREGNGLVAGLETGSAAIAAKIYSGVTSCFTALNTLRTPTQTQYGYSMWAEVSEPVYVDSEWSAIKSGAFDGIIPISVNSGDKLVLDLLEFDTAAGGKAGTFEIAFQGHQTPPVTPMMVRGNERAAAEWALRQYPTRVVSTCSPTEKTVAVKTGKKQ